MAFVQTATSGVPTGSASSKTATFASAQTAHNLNAVAISFGNASGAVTATVTGVTDTEGNAYVPATSLATFLQNGTNPPAGGDALQIFYCPNIAAAGAGANVVTVNLSTSSPFFIVTVVEHSGLATSSPVDVTASATSDGVSPTSASSGSATTTNANDLILGAFCMFDGPSAAGGTFTSRSSAYTMLVEDKTVSSTGSYSADATSTGTAGWAAQLVAFKAASTSVNLVGSATLKANASGTLKVGRNLIGSATLRSNSSGNITVGTPLAIVQSKLVDGTTSTTVAATFTSSQTGGNTNVVIVGWGAATGTVTGVTDTKGNTYTQVILTQGSANSLSTWISTGGIAAGSNTVTATFSTSLVHDIIIAEYPGILVTDGFSGAFASSNAPNSGSITTTNANDVLIGALWIRGGAFSAGEPGWVIQQGTTATVVVLEDKVVSSTGSFAATATMASNAWISQIVALMPAPTGVNFVGTATLQAAATGTVTVGKNFGGSATLHAAATGTIKVGKALKGTGTLKAAATGSIKVGRNLAGNATLRAVATGTITIPVTISFSGVATLVCQSFGKISIPRNNPTRVFRLTVKPPASALVTVAKRPVVKVSASLRNAVLGVKNPQIGRVLVVDFSGK